MRLGLLYKPKTPLFKSRTKGGYRDFFEGSSQADSVAWMWQMASGRVPDKRNQKISRRNRES